MSEQPTQRQQPPKPETTTDVLTQDQKRYLKEISNAQTRIETLVTELKGKKVGDRSNKEGILEESIERGYNAVNAILAEFGVNPIETPTLKMVQADNYKVESMYKSILEITLLETQEAVEESDENSDSSATSKPVSPSERLEAIKKALTGKVEKPKGNLLKNRWVQGAGVVLATGAFMGANVLHQKGVEQRAETQKTIAGFESTANAATKEMVKILVEGGKVNILNSKEVNQILGTQFSDGDKVVLSSDQVTKLGGGEAQRTSIEMYYGGVSIEPLVRKLVDPVLPQN